MQKGGASPLFVVRRLWRLYRGQVLYGPARAGVEGRWIVRTRLQPQAANERNHRTVVSTKFQPRIKYLRIVALRHFMQACAQRGIGAHAARHHQARQSGVLQSALALDHKSVNNSVLKRACNVSTRLRVLVGVLQCGERKSFQSAEAEVKSWSICHRAREAKPFRIALPRQLLERRPAGVG